MIRRTFAAVMGFALAFLVARSLSPRVSEPVPATSENTEPVSAMRQDRDPRASLVGFEMLAAEIERTERRLDAGRYRELLEGGWCGVSAATITFRWAKEDPADMWAWLEDGGRERLAGLSVERIVFEQWFPRDPDAAIRALRGADGHWREDVVGGLMVDLVGLDKEAAAQVLSRAGELMAMEPRFSTYGLGDGGLENALALPPSFARDRLIGLLAREPDLETALANLPEEDRGAVMAVRARGMLMMAGSAGDPERLELVAQSLETMPRSMSWNRAAEIYIRQLSRTDPNAALLWAGENLDGAALGSAIGSVVRARLQEDPALAKGLIESLPPGGVRRSAASDMLNALGQSDAAEAIRWGREEEAKSGSLSYDAWGQLGRHIATNDPRVAREALSDRSATLSGGFTSHAMWHLVAAAPRETLDWATGVGGERGAQLVEAGLKAWREKAPEAAAAWEETP